MDSRGKMNVARSVLAVTLAVLALALVSPITANAQVTVSHVRVTVGGTGSTAVYCDTGTVCPDQVWNLGSGVTLAGGQTLVLTQTGLLIVGGAGIGGNFDTSDRVKPTAPLELACGPTAPATLCTVTIDLDTGAGLTTVYTNSGVGTTLGNPIANFNVDDGSGTHPEQAQWTAPVFSAANFTLQLGYADNVHGCTTGCFPNPFDGSTGTTAATVFKGAGVTDTLVPSCGNNCYDSGALLITGVTVGPLITVTQGGWGAAPHGNNPGSILAANFPGVFGTAGVTIGCTASGGSLTFKPVGSITGQQAIQNFLPQGGTPGTLAAGNVVNPTTSDAGVFAGQVLALQLNVSFSGPVFPGGLGNLVITSGPATGLTVGQVLGLANRALGGCLSSADIALLTAHGITSISQLNDIVDSINNSFDSL
jgi:hypothetical protein